MEKFSLKTGIYAGAGAVSVLETFGAKRLLLVTDPYFMKNGTAQRIAGLSKAEQVEYFDRVQPDPTVALAAEGTETAVILPLYQRVKEKFGDRLEYICNDYVELAWRHAYRGLFRLRGHCLLNLSAAAQQQRQRQHKRKSSSHRESLTLTRIMT